MTMQRAGSAMTENWVVNESPQGWLTIDRVLRQSRAATPPPGLESGEDYRQWLLERVESQSITDETESERQESAQWRDRIAGAPESELWAEYTARWPGV